MSFAPLIWVTVLSESISEIVRLISSLWSNVFVPNPEEIEVKHGGTPEELFNKLNYRGQSAIVFQYLINLW